MSSTPARLFQKREYQREYRRQNRARVNAYRRMNYRQTQGAPNSRKHWTEAEDRLVLERQESDRALAARIGRSVMAIQVRRSRIS